MVLLISGNTVKSVKMCSFSVTDKDSKPYLNL